MSLFKSNAWILMRSGTATLPFMLVLSVVFNVLWLQNSLAPGTFRYVKTYLLITCLPSLFFGFLLGIGLAKQRGLIRRCDEAGVPQWAKNKPN